MNNKIIVDNNKVVIQGIVIKECIDHDIARRYARHHLDNYLDIGYQIEYRPNSQWLLAVEDRQLSLAHKRMDSLIN